MSLDLVYTAVILAPTVFLRILDFLGQLGTGRGAELCVLFD